MANIGTCLPDLSLERRVALVTGAGTGVGRQMALALAEAGAELVLVGRRLELLDETANCVPTSAEVVAGHITEARTIDRLRAFAGRVDILVNNAGLSEPTPWLEDSAEEWHRVLALNVVAPAQLSQVFVPGMLSRASGGSLA